MFDCINFEMTTEEVKAMSDDEYFSIYKENEEINAHTENILLDAMRFGDETHVDRAKRLLFEVERNMGIDYRTVSARDSLYAEIWEMKNGTSFEEFLKNV